MAKTINWPQQFLETVKAEDTDTVKCALRLGTLYFDNQYWSEGEVVDIRVEHQIVRQGQIVGDLKACTIAELSPEDLEAYKQGFQSPQEIIQLLERTYNKPVDENTVVTAVYYKNLPISSEE